MSFSPFSTPQQQPLSLFQSQPQQFQQSSPLFPQQQQQPQQQQFLPQFQQQQQHQLQQQQLSQQQHQFYLFTNDKAPANYSTKWANLHPDSQKVLLQIEVSGGRILMSRLRARLGFYCLWLLLHIWLLATIL